MARTRPYNPNATSPWPFVGMAGLASVLFLYGASVLLVPWYAVAGLVVLWVVLFVQACRWWTPRPVGVAVLPAVAVAVWVGVVLLTATGG
ncbi:hypothetical protein [Nocardioides dongkuii]|uniref:hypothetical protein n=1 Tax=Nocardioides dongkuii TaxID=2760089 RepID=UPI001FD5A4EF|nr:hypothetical protein [Nocardioides dongkuii]